MEANPFFDATTNSMTARMMTARTMMDDDGKDDDGAMMTLRMTARTMTARMMMAQTMMTRLGKGGKYKNTTISINPLVVSWTLLDVQSFDVERKQRNQTTTTPSETQEGGAI